MWIQWPTSVSNCMQPLGVIELNVSLEMYEKNIEMANIWLSFLHTGLFPILLLYNISIVVVVDDHLFVFFFSLFLSIFFVSGVYNSLIRFLLFRRFVLWFCMFDGVIWNVKPRTFSVSNEFSCSVAHFSLSLRLISFLFFNFFFFLVALFYFIFSSR